MGNEEDDNTKATESETTAASEDGDDDEKEEPTEEDESAAATTNEDDDDDDNQQKQRELHDEEETRDQVRNNSLKRLVMMANGIDDDYLCSLLGIFKPKITSTATATSRDRHQQHVAQYSNLEELNLFANRLSNASISRLLRSLDRFPKLERLYIGYQQFPLAVPASIASVSSAVSIYSSAMIFNPSRISNEF